MDYESDDGTDDDMPMLVPVSSSDSESDASSDYSDDVDVLHALSLVNTTYASGDFVTYTPESPTESPDFPQKFPAGLGAPERGGCARRGCAAPRAQGAKIGVLFYDRPIGHMDKMIKK